MLELIRTWAANFGNWCKVAVRGWNWFWFTPVDPATLGLVRILAASILLFIHLTCLPHFEDLVGPHAWIDLEAVDELIAVPNDPLYQPKEHDTKAIRKEKEQTRHFVTWHRLSIWLLIQDPTWMRIVQGFFLVCMACYVIGFCSRPMAIIAWFAHLSYVTRGYSIWFGMDCILLFILFYLMFAPSGAAWSVDRLLVRYRALKRSGPLAADLDAPLSWGANTVLRMIQIHMGIVYLCSALSKLQGPAWWNGLATWIPMNTQEFALFDMRWLGERDWMWQWTSSLGTFATIAFELMFIFLVWLPWWRPLILVGAVLLHAGIGLFMGLFGFGVVMLTGCSSFLKPSEVRWFFATLFQGAGGKTFTYDSANRAQNRIARLIATFDVWRQVHLASAHAAVKPNAPPGTLLLADGTTRQGMEIFWSLTGSLRTLWIAFPVAWWFFRAELKAMETSATVDKKPAGAPPIKKAV